MWAVFLHIRLKNIVFLQIPLRSFAGLDNMQKTFSFFMVLMRGIILREFANLFATSSEDRKRRVFPSFFFHVWTVSIFFSSFLFQPLIPSIFFSCSVSFTQWMVGSFPVTFSSRFHQFQSKCQMKPPFQLSHGTLSSWRFTLK